MTEAQFTYTTSQMDILGLVCAERQKSVSRREWLHRLQGFGLCVEGDTLCSVRTRRAVCTLPAHLCA